MDFWLTAPQNQILNHFSEKSLQINRLHIPDLEIITQKSCKLRRIKIIQRNFSKNYPDEESGRHEQAGKTISLIGQLHKLSKNSRSEYFPYKNILLKIRKTT